MDKKPPQSVQIGLLAPAAGSESIIYWTPPLQFLEYSELPYINLGNHALLTLFYGIMSQQYSFPRASELSQDLFAKLALLQQQLASLREELDHGKQLVETLRHLLFGPKSERHVPDLDPNQGEPV